MKTQKSTGIWEEKDALTTTVSSITAKQKADWEIQGKEFKLSSFHEKIFNDIYFHHIIYTNTNI